MTDYKAIKGKTILSVASDLGAEGEGEIWFNTASSDFKTIVAVGSWASGGDLNDSRKDTEDAERRLRLYVWVEFHLVSQLTLRNITEPHGQKETI